MRASTICKQPGCPARATQRGYCAGHAGAVLAKPRPSAASQGYGAKWRAAREAFLKAHPMCEWGGCFDASTDVDHIIPHKGDKVLFWDRGNWQALCHSHHSRKTVTYDGGFGRARVRR